MLEGDEMARALAALHAILVRIRRWGYMDTDPRTIGKALDTVEYLVLLLRESENKAKEFEEHLRSLADQYPELKAGLGAFQEGSTR
ncbi:MAG: hypothetical protein MPN21_18495 [Thermoanaerobaculia bacterium]|nr:hypothetical protein [Thermoanaerobaculia bacterium]